MILCAENIEIRGVEQKASTKEGKGDFLIVRFEDETGKAYEVIDRELERKQYYKRGTVGKLYVKLYQGRDWARLEIKDFKASKAKEKAEG